MDIGERFPTFSSPNYFSRVDSTHPLELHIGLDEQRRKSIELRASFKPRKVKGTESIEVSQYTKPEYNTLRFSLCNDEISGLFYTFCEDIIEETRVLRNNDEGYQAVVNRFYQWKKLFVSNSKQLLTEPEIMGLIGQILFLRDYLGKKIGINNALRAWSGQELTHKDFSYGDSWYEVKTVSRGKDTVKISSLEQLDSDKTGQLSVFFLEKMSEAYNGTSLNRLVIDTAQRFDTQEAKDDFLSKVSVLGYSYNNYYDSFVYEVSSVAKYKIDESFPRLTRNSVSSAICKVSYELSLTEIAMFEIKEA